MRSEIGVVGGGRVAMDRVLARAASMTGSSGPASQPEGCLRRPAALPRQLAKGPCRFDIASTCGALAIVLCNHELRVIDGARRNSFEAAAQSELRERGGDRHVNVSVAKQRCRFQPGVRTDRALRDLVTKYRYFALLLPAPRLLASSNSTASSGLPLCFALGCGQSLPLYQAFRRRLHCTAPVPSVASADAGGPISASEKPPESFTHARLLLISSPDEAVGRMPRSLGALF